MCDLLVYLDVLNTFVPEDHLFFFTTRYILSYPVQNYKDFFLFFALSEKIILNAKGSESLRTHYFFT